MIVMTDERDEAELQFTHLAPALDAPTRDSFERTVRLCHAVLAQAASECGLPRRIEVIVAADFEQTVRSRMRRVPGQESEPLFFADRPGGRVAAKTLPQDDSYNDLVVVFDAAGGGGSLSGQGIERLRTIALIGHEFAHMALERLALASGATKGVVYPSFTPTEIARSLSRIVNHEYRADRLSEVIVEQLCTTERKGQTLPVRSWDVFAGDYLSGLEAMCSQAYAEGPGAVQAYRERRIDLDTMFSTVTRLTESVLVAYIHARALADCVGEVALLDDHEIGALPFVRLYLADTLPKLVEAIRTSSLLMTPNEWGQLDGRVVDAGEQAVREIWRRLGLTFVESARQPYRIDVAAPLLA